MDDSSGMPGTRQEELEKETPSDRRDFVKKAGKVAIAVPAVALLLSIRTRSAGADTMAISGLGSDAFRNPV